MPNVWQFYYFVNFCKCRSSKPRKQLSPMWPPMVLCWAKDKQVTFVWEQQVCLAKCQSVCVKWTYNNFNQDAIILSFWDNKSDIFHLATQYKAENEIREAARFLSKAISTSKPHQIMPRLNDTIRNFTARCCSFKNHDNQLGACTHQPKCNKH